MCHANSLFFLFAFAACGAGCCVYDRKSFEPEHLLRTLAGDRFTFTSLVPTHYITMLGLSDAIKRGADVDSVTKLLISSAPARRETKLALMEHFRNSQLYEAYGSTEMGWVTMLRPDEQLSKLGSIGREMTGTGRIKLLSSTGTEVPNGEPGEIYARTPYAFQGYWKLPEKTAEAFRGDYCTVGDIGRRDGDGYYYLVDRKSNMIISGGENVYPSEVEQVLGTNPRIKDVAVIGVPDPKWGEATHAVVILHPGTVASEKDIIDWCRDRIAGFKRPKSISFIAENEMPRTATERYFIGAAGPLRRARIVKGQVNGSTGSDLVARHFTYRASIRFSTSWERRCCRSSRRHWRSDSAASTSAMSRPPQWPRTPTRACATALAFAWPHPVQEQPI